jgi:hypothetical protein
MSSLVSNWAGRLFRGILLFIDSLVYRLIALIYRIFFLVSEAKLFDYNDSDTIGRIVQNIYVVLGVVMLFVFAYNIILLIINPDKMNDNSDKSIKGIIKNTVVSIVVIALLPTIFDFASTLQSEIIESDVIGHVILGGTSALDGKNIKTAGTEVAINIFAAFYHPQDEYGNAISPSECQDADGNINSDVAICETYINAIAEAEETNNLNKFTNNSDLNEAVTSGEMEYIPIISTAAGLLAAYLFLSFTLDLGVRAAKLAVLQLVAPVPIVLRITKPHGGIFSKWLDEIKRTYLMVFLRIAVIYFAIFSIELVITNVNIFSSASSDGSVSSLVVLIANVIVILGILQFAKEAPKLIENFFGSMGGSWRIKDKLNNNEYAKRLATGVGAAGVNFAGNTLGAVVDGIHDGRKKGLGAGLKTAGNYLKRIPGSVVGAGFYGIKNGGNVDFGGGLKKGYDDLKEQINVSRAMEQQQYEARKAKKAGLDASHGRSADDKVIPGTYLIESIQETLNRALEDGFFDKLINKFNDSARFRVASIEEKNVSGTKNNIASLLEYANKGVAELKEAQKKAIEDLNKLHARGKITDDTYQKQKDNIENRTKNAIKEQYLANFNKNKEMINEIAKAREKSILEGFSSLSKDNQNAALKNGNESIDMKELINTLKTTNGTNDFSIKTIEELMKLDGNLGQIQKNEQYRQKYNEDLKREKEGKK